MTDLPTRRLPTHEGPDRERRFKRLLPTSLFARALLILLLPILLAQGTAAWLFYNRHWDNIQRYLASSVAGDIALLTESFATSDQQDRNELAELSNRTLGIALKWQPGAHLRPNAASPFDDSLFSDAAHQIESRMHYPFQLERLADDMHVRIAVQLPDGELSFLMSKKRLSSPTIAIWFAINAAVLLFVILVAVLFLRNQVRPIAQLARAADRFGRGQEMPGFQPHGAREVRMAARALLTMKERLRRMLASRTDMLAAISHDLRTPLARLRLQLEMLPDASAAQPMIAELHGMESMIQEYLDFVRGDGNEAAVREPLRPLLESVAADYARAGQSVTLEPGASPVVSMRPRAFRRALSNLIDNALRHGGSECRLSLEASPTLVSVYIEDNGPGIAEGAREEMFLPFRRGDTARTGSAPTGGAGLGLSIVREVMHGMGGQVRLSESARGGLLATLVLLR